MKPLCFMRPETLIYRAKDESADTPQRQVWAVMSQAALVQSHGITAHMSLSSPLFFNGEKVYI